MTTSCLIIAGEQSGEDHAMSFLPELRSELENCHFFGVCGDKLIGEGVEPLYHLKDFSSMGITEVLGKLPFYFKAMDRILNEVKKRKTKTAILIDFQGFNLKLAKKLKKRGVKVLYYVAPQAWAWKSYRAKVLEKCVHTLFTILPFEKKWFQERGVTRVRSVIHPLAIEYKDQMSALRKRSYEDFQNRSLRVLILPGSRNTEVELMLPVFLEAKKIIEKKVSAEFAIVKTNSVQESNYQKASELKSWNSKDLFKACEWADVCIATSGTVTLATGLFALPTVVSYKLTMVNEFLLKMIIKYSGAVSLTNIIHEKMIFPEYLHYQADKYNVSKEVLKWAKNQKHFDETVGILETTYDLLKGDDFHLVQYLKGVILDKK